MGLSGKGIRNVPIWIRLTNLPMIGWSKLGICWLASHVGKFLCMDQATESLKRLGYAKCMVEVSPSSGLPESFSVLLPEGDEHVVSVSYVWKPDICDACKVFGHLRVNCPLSNHTGVPPMAPSPGPDVSNNGTEVNINGNKAVKANAFVNKRQAKISLPRNNVNVRVNMQKKWTRVEGQPHKKHSGLGKPTALPTGNRFNVLNDQGRRGEATNSFLDLEEGEVDTNVASGLNEENVTNLQNEELCNKLNKEDVYLEVANELRTNDVSFEAVGTVSQANVSANASIAVESEIDGKQSEDAMQSILNDINTFESTKENSGLVETSVHVQPLKPLSNVFGLSPGFLQGTKSVLESSSLHVNLEPAVELHTSSVVNESQVLDKFLQDNFDITAATCRNKVNHSKVKGSKCKPAVERTVLETIEDLGVEIEAGNLDPFLCKEKRKLMDLMTVNYKALQSGAANKNLAVAHNPYADLTPPPGYKPRPPDINVQILPPLSKSTKRSKGSGSTSIRHTRSTSRTKASSPFDNG